MLKNVMRLLLCSLCLPALSVRAAQPTTAATTQPARAFARFVPEAFDDVAWENDRIAFRAYGPALEGQQKTGSGIDVWVKSTRKLVIDRWYKTGDYLRDHGEGLDCYSVGQGRGCGGLGIWNGKTLDVSRVWKSHKIIRSGPDEAVIELTYAPWTAGDRKVWETRRITLKVGSNLNRMESTIDSDKPDPLTVGIGINQRNAEGGEATLDKRKGMIAYWEPPQNDNGSVACGVLVDPAMLLRLANADHHFLALITVTPGKPFVYYAGAGWSKSGDFPTPASWESYLRGNATDFTAATATDPPSRH